MDGQPTHPMRISIPSPSAAAVAGKGPHQEARGLSPTQDGVVQSPMAPWPSHAKRYHEFDALRGFAMLLGIVLHGALSFLPLPIWPAQDLNQNDTVYGFLLHAIHGFRMPAFFLVSGYFTMLLWRKRGGRGLLAHRVKRILLPLIVGTIAVWPLMIGLGYWGAAAKAKRAAVPSSRSDIWTAAKQGDLLALQRLLADGVDLNRRDALGVAPLEWAAIYGQAEAVSWLIEHGAAVNARSPQGSTPLHAAACFGRTEAARRLIELGADPQARNDRGDTPLRAARVDMGVVRFFAGLLGVPVDEATLVVARRQTADYIEAIVAGGSAPPGPKADRGRGDGIGDPTEAAAGAGASDDGRGQRLGRLWGIYYAVAFIPLFHHLWFLSYLLWLVGIFLIVVGVGPRILRGRLPDWMVATPGCLLWLVPLTLIPQLFMNQTFVADTAAGLLPWLPKLAYYGVFFGFGAVCFGRPEFEERAGHRWAVLLLLAFPALLLGLALLPGRADRPAAHFGVCLASVVYAWLMVLGSVGLFRRFFAQENPRIRYLSDASYWLYLAHLPLTIGLQIWISNWDIHHLPKFLLVCGLTFGILIALYEYGVRYTFLGAGLNGRKIRPPR